MKNRIVPTQNERFLDENDFVVSKTDLKGRITYCNEIFIKLSGYSEQELLNQQHNIIRHPDMPRGVFKFLWDTIDAGNECFAYVKNMAKDGSYYWVFANITPDRDESGKINGFFSVRRKPSSDAVLIMTQIYAQMLEVEQQAGPREAINASLTLLTNKLEELNTSYEEFILSI